MKRLGSRIATTAVLALYGLMLTGMTACGGASKAAAPEVASTDGAEPAAAKDGTGDKDPEVAFAEAEKELQDLFGDEKKTPEKPEAPAQPAAEPTPMAGEEDEGEEISALQQQNRCDVACKALASMLRSAQQVCEMTGEGDSRCESLRERVERARSTVYASCPACAAARP